MQAIWIGAETELMDTVLLSLQSRWPDAQITASQVAAQIVEWTEQDEYEVVFVYLGSEGANEALACVRAIRNVSEIPILAVAEESSGLDRVKALYMGCDSVITADSGPIEIQAHTMAVLRRVRGRQPELESPIQLGEIQISPATHEVYVRGQRVNLTPTEFRLIHALVRRQGSVATHDMLLRAIWGEGVDGNGNVLRKYVQRLRSKLNDDPEHPRWIVTVPSIGYRLVRPGNAIPGAVDQEVKIG